MKNFFQFRSVDEEIRHKLDALDKEPQEFQTSLFHVLEQCGARPSQAEYVVSLCGQLSSVASDDDYINYMSHSIRLAGALALYRGQYIEPEIVLCLVHNVQEKGMLSTVKGLLKRFSTNVLSAVRLLTVDRTREYNHDYLRSYYDTLARHDLIILRAMDKLDNLLCFPRYPTAVDRCDVVLQYLCPLIPAEHRRLQEYLEEVIARVKSLEFRGSGAKNSSNRRMQYECAE